ncbi:MAG: PD-(D/E)XK nuclease family protein [Actinobacteria bacterium]|nr:MAG: PD-(D/E)XK nuclease family protein [Actinomycetota bacterium]
MEEMAVYSHSRLEAFRNCPLGYKYQYIDGIKSDRDGIEAFMGSRAHEILEKLYRDLKLSKLNTEEELIDHYNRIWEQNWHDNVLIVRKDYTAENYRETGERGIRDYYRRYAPFAQGKTVWIEQRIKMDLDSAGKYSMNGFVDRLVDLGNGTYEVHDYKTSNTLPSQEQLDRDRQLALYQLAVPDYFSDAERVELVWHYLVFDKELRSVRTEEQLAGLKKDVIALINVIESTEEFEAKESALCEWCDYQDICPKRKHFFAIEALPPREFKEDDGVKLADRYVALKEEEKRVAEEIEKVKHELGEYAEQMGVENVRGSDAVLSVKKAEKLCFPPAKSPDRALLERVCKDLGRFEEVSTISTPRLSKVVAGCLWGEEELKELEPYITREEAVYIRKKKAGKIEEPD